MSSSMQLTRVNHPPAPAPANQNAAPIKKNHFDRVSADNIAHYVYPCLTLKERLALAHCSRALKNIRDLYTRTRHIASWLDLLCENAGRVPTKSKAVKSGKRRKTQVEQVPVPLSLREIHQYGADLVTDQFASGIFSRAALLRRVDLSHATKVTDKALWTLGEHCQNLEYLNLSCNPNATSRGFRRLQNCRNLTCLELFGSSVNDNALRVIGECIPVSFIDLGDTPKVSSRGVVDLARGLNKRLVSISLNVASKDIGNDGIRALGELCPKLTNFELTECHKVTDVGFNALIQGCRQLVSCTISDCTSFTSPTAQMLAQHTTQLTQLDLSCSEHIDDETVNLIAKRCSLIRDLNLDSCPACTNDTLDNISKYLPGLERFKMRHNDRIMDFGVHLLTLRCEKLSDVAFDDCSRLTDTALGFLSRCPLEYASLKSRKFSIKGVVTLVTHRSQHLREIVLSKDIPKEDLETHLAKFTNLSVIRID